MERRVNLSDDMDVIESLRLRLTPKTTRLKRKQTRRDPPEVGEEGPGCSV